MSVTSRAKYIILQNTPNFILQPVMRRWKRWLLREGVGADPKDVFTKIFRTRGWPGESVSGVGSSLERTVVARRVIPEIVREYNVRTMLDAPCGDFHWMQHVDLGDCVYIGGDIVEEIARANQEKFGSPNRSFRRLDIIKDDLPHADLVLCRDCFIHLPFDMAIAAIRNFKRAKIKYLLTTTFPEKKRHWDTPPGGLHWINFRLKPFNFPPALKTILEEPDVHASGDTYGDKSLGLWALEDVKL
jgi:hypothetical protein